MSKSLGNYIGVSEPPEDMYGKVMSLPDRVMPDYFELVTDVPQDEVDGIRVALQSGELNPRDIKMRLAREIVSQFHSAEAAQQAEHEFRRVFQQRELPSEMPVISVSRAGLEDQVANIVKLLADHSIVDSRSRAKELVREGAVELAGRRVLAEEPMVRIFDGTILKVGKRRFYRIALVD